MHLPNRCVQAALLLVGVLAAGLLLQDGQEHAAETLSVDEPRVHDRPAPRTLRGAEALPVAQVPAPTPAPAVAPALRRAPVAAKVHQAPGVVLSMAPRDKARIARAAATRRRRGAVDGPRPEAAADALPAPAGFVLPPKKVVGGPIPVGDLTERAPDWFRLNSPGEDQRYTPAPGASLADAALLTEAARPPAPMPDEEARPKPSGPIELRLIVRTPGVEGVELRVNGEPLGKAPLDLECTLPRPGDLRIEATKAGHARVIHTRRLGEHHEGGRLEIELEVPLDVPAAARPAADPVLPTRTEGDE